ncbi:type 1 glutamine amidotransferase [candidate division KSB1 bacterium]|nr:type 1 glutamine amidotransferase [candidate division KSB1 bacterium]
MRLHVLQHVPFETPAYILDWARGRNLPVMTTPLYQAPNYPNQMDFDALVIMGGPMGVHDEGEHHWLKNEKHFIEKAIISEKKILGICLGAQLLASVLGAKVYKNPDKEIGWYPVSLSGDGQSNPLLKDLPATFNAFHWHGDTFDIPEHGIRIAESKACTNQGFVMNNHIIGLQFHLESTTTSIKELVENGRSELVEGKWIQNEEVLMNQTDQHVAESNRWMASILNKWIM